MRKYFGFIFMLALVFYSALIYGQIYLSRRFDFSSNENAAQGVVFTVLFFPVIARFLKFYFENEK